MASNEAQLSELRLGLQLARKAIIFKSLYIFQGAPDGAMPEASLINVRDIFYGTTRYGGSGTGCSGYHGCGTVFKIAPSGAESVLYSFAGGADGRAPSASLVESNGTLYGATSGGGSSDAGTVFTITPSGKESVLYSFTGGSDGGSPQAGLIDIQGVLYGTTNAGGVSGAGTVFKITPSGKERTLYRFKGGSDGAYPDAGLIDVDGTLYGTTTNGGARCFDIGGGCGTVFKITSSGAETIVHRFVGKLHSNGATPTAGLIDVAGTLYGTTLRGGRACAIGCGTVFKITPSGKESVIHDFGAASDGKYPYAGLIAVNRTLYGTAAGGGASGQGTVFKITTSGTESVVYNFAGGSDGATPVAGLIAPHGTLYGTTFGGGNSLNGTAFSLTL